MKIESLNNIKVKEWIKLQEKKYRDINKEFLIEGDHLLNEALKVNRVKEIISTDEAFKKEGIPFYLVTSGIIKKISKQVSGTNVIAVVKKSTNDKIEGNVCLLDNIQDPGNLGTIIRSALAFNIKTIILSNETVDLYNDKVIRASEGMLFKLNFRRDKLEDVIKELKENNYNIYGTNVKNGNKLKDISFKEKSAIIIGNEGKGMRKELEDKCDFLINIPISDNCESLNASVAASIIFYEMNRKI